MSTDATTTEATSNSWSLDSAADCQREKVGWNSWTRSRSVSKQQPRSKDVGRLLGTVSAMAANRKKPGCVLECGFYSHSLSVVARIVVVAERCQRAIADSMPQTSPAKPNT